MVMEKQTDRQTNEQIDAAKNPTHVTTVDVGNDYYCFKTISLRSRALYLFL